MAYQIYTGDIMTSISSDFPPYFKIHHSMRSILKFLKLLAERIIALEPF